LFDANAERCRIPAQEKEKKGKVFIGHGGDSQWRDLKDHLHEKHDYAIEAYEIGSRAGHTIRDILEEMLDSSSFALLVMTGEDETKDGKTLARQNVVHEAGLFQGKLGFSRAIILLEDGTEEFSNIHGLQQIRFSKGRIRESFGDVLAVLKRELG
jgi:predicted nucleotide-binding protein